MLPQELFWILTPKFPSLQSADVFPVVAEGEKRRPEIRLRFAGYKFPFPGFLTHSDRIFTDCPNHFLDFNLESLKFFTKNTFIMKNLTDFS